MRGEKRENDVKNPQRMSLLLDPEESKEKKKDDHGKASREPWDLEGESSTGRDDHFWGVREEKGIVWSRADRPVASFEKGKRSPDTLSQIKKGFSSDKKRA